MEWSRPLSNQGSARHLWRRAADLSYKHPEGAAQGGHAQVMLAWAKAEYERDNVGNARIILAEALRRSPGVQALYVLAANIELVAGNLGEFVKFLALKKEKSHRVVMLHLVRNASGIILNNIN